MSGIKRQVLSISLPPEMSKWIRNLVADSEFASVSDYLRDLVRVDMQLRRIRSAERREHRARIARSMSDHLRSCDWPHGQKHR
ncbi:MAG: type II toxin-antitoxin system ParD family antitoxin [Pyrinomonadaceae bacterium]